MISCRLQYYFSGILSSNGREWKEQRRFALSTLRDFGMGKLHLENCIIDEAKALTMIIDAKNGEPFDIHYPMLTSVRNVIYSMVFGKRCHHGDTDLIEVTDKLEENVRNSALLNTFLTPLPWLRYLPGDPFRYWKTMENVAFYENKIKELINEHKRTYDPNITRDFIDAYISKMIETTDEDNTSFDGK